MHPRLLHRFAQGQPHIRVLGPEGLRAVAIELVFYLGKRIFICVLTFVAF